MTATPPLARRPVLRPRAVAATAVAAAGGLIAAMALRRRIEAIRAVAPELWSPVLALPLGIWSRAHLAVGRRLPSLDTGLAAGVEVREEALPAGPGGHATRIHRYSRAERTAPSAALVWIHGGGLMMGHARQDDGWCSRLADELGILVVTVEYRLAPEHPFPAALDDCTAALRWVHEEADRLGVDRMRIAVGGVSAGGGLAAALTQRARDDGGPAVCFQLLNQPMLDDRTAAAPAGGGRGTFVWTPASNRFGWGAYLGRRTGRAPAPRGAVPARVEQVAGLPPAWIGVGELDLFHDEDVAHAERLERAGVPVELRVEPGMYHGADLIARRAHQMRRYTDAMVAALAAGLAEATT